MKDKEKKDKNFNRNEVKNEFKYKTNPLSGMVFIAS